MHALTMPVLYIAGINDIITDTRKAAERLSRLVPQAKINIDDVSHVIINTTDTVIPFLLEKK